MKKLFLLSFMPFLFSNTIAQQADTTGIKQTISTLFNAMRKGDSTLLRSVFSKDMILQSIANDMEGKAVLTTEKADGFVKAIGTPHAAIYDERIVYGTIQIDGSLASVWAPYQFYLGDKFSHCGVDVFQLMKTTDGWKIIYIVDTRRKDKCINY